MLGRFVNDNHAGCSKEKKTRDEMFVELQTHGVDISMLWFGQQLRLSDWPSASMLMKGICESVAATVAINYS